MYAIIAEGGRQYKVEEGQELDIDYRDVPKGNELKFQKVLALSGGDRLQLGTPAVEGASVTAEVLGVTFGQKLTVEKLRRRKNSRRKTGHRQLYTKVRINKIETPQGGGEATAASDRLAAEGGSAAVAEQPEVDDQV